MGIFELNFKCFCPGHFLVFNVSRERENVYDLFVLEAI